MINLSAEEKIKFAAYLEQEAATQELLLGQMATLSVAQIMGSQMRAEILAFKVVAKYLRSWVTQNLS